MTSSMYNEKIFQDPGIASLTAVKSDEGPILSQTFSRPYSQFLQGFTQVLLQN